MLIIHTQESNVAVNIQLLSTAKYRLGVIENVSDIFVGRTCHRDQDVIWCTDEDAVATSAERG